MGDHRRETREPEQFTSGHDVLVQWGRANEWVNRRVVSMRLREDGCTYQRVSIDYDLPEELGHGRPPEAPWNDPLVVVPLGFHQKNHDYHRLNVVDEAGDRLGLLTAADQTVILAEFVLRELTRTEIELDSDPNTFLQDNYGTFEKIVSGDPKSARTAHHTLGSSLADLDPPISVANAVLSVSELFVDHFLLAAAAHRTRLDSVRLIKYSLGGPQPSPEGSRSSAGTAAQRSASKRFRKLRSIRLFGQTWKTHRALAIPVDSQTDAGSHHFEFESAPGTLVDTISLVRRTIDTGTADAPPEILDTLKDARTRIVRRVFRYREFAESAETGGKHRYLQIVRLVPERTALTSSATWAPVVALAVVVVLGVLSGYSYFGSSGRAAQLETECVTVLPLDGVVDARCLTEELNSAPALLAEDFTRTAPVIIFLASFALTWVVRRREHPDTTRILRPYRWVAFWTAVVLAVYALLLATLSPVQIWAPSGVLAVALLLLAQRAARISRSPREPRNDHEVPASLGSLGH